MFTIFYVYNSKHSILVYMIRCQHCNRLYNCQSLKQFLKKSSYNLPRYLKLSKIIIYLLSLLLLTFSKNTLVFIKPMYLMQLFVKASIEIDSEIPSKKRSKWRQINNIAVTFQSIPRPHIKQKSKPEKVLTKNEKMHFCSFPFF